jgi:hypothetical protein
MVRFCKTTVFAAAVVALVVHRPATAGEPIEDALAATFRITDNKSSCTGFLILTESPGGTGKPKMVLVTAAHVLEGMTGSDCRLVLRARHTDLSYVRKETTISIRNGDQPRWKRHPELDIAALVVDVPEGLAVKTFAFRQLADDKWISDRKIRVGKDVYIPCFPVKLEANEAGWPILRKGSVATHPLTPVKSAKTMIIDFNTFGGDSGAPVVVCDGKEPVVVGMVLGMHRQTDKSSTPFEERTAHTPLGLAIAVQAPLVRETVDLLQKEVKGSERR